MMKRLIVILFIVPSFEGKPLARYDVPTPEGESEGVRENIRRFRLNDIKSQMMGVFGPNRTIPVFNLSQLKWEVNLPSSPPSAIQILPSCSPPRNADESEWSNLTVYNLYFNLHNLSKGLDSTSMILNAKLVLKKEADDHSEMAYDSEPNSYEESQTLRVMVYSYNRPLKKMKTRKKLVANVLFTPSDEKELVIDLTSVLRNWLSGNQRTANHGLLLEAKSAVGQTANISTYFARPQCDGNGNLPASPSLNVTLDNPGEITREAAEALSVPLVKPGEKIDNGKLISAALSQLRKVQYKLHTTPKPLKTAEPQFITLSVLEEIDHLRTEPTQEALETPPNDEPAKSSFFDVIEKLLRSG